MQFGYGIGTGVSPIQSSRQRWLITLMAFLLVAGLILIAPPAGAQVGPVNPPSYVGELAPGASVTIEKSVDVPDVPPMLDVCLLVDLSGSYFDDLPIIKSLAPDLWDALADGENVELQMGLASFVDYPISPWGVTGDYAYQLNQQLTTDRATWLSAVDSMTIRNGGDVPESQYEGLYEIASGCDWRSDASKFVVITTDASFHTPVNDGNGVYTDGYPGASRDQAVTALTGAGVKVVALTAPGSGSEMVDIATATGGTTEATSSSSSNIATAVINALGGIFYDITADTSNCAPLVIAFNALPTAPVLAGTQLMFDETITVPGASDVTYDCDVVFYADDTEIGTQHVSITVPPQGEEPDVSCQTGETCGFEGETYTGTIVCEDCDVFINEPGPGRFVDLRIEPNKEDPEIDPSFVVTLIREDRPRAWWRTAALFVFNGDVEEKVGRCSFRESLRWFARGQEPGRNCSIIVPLRHNRLQYTLFWYDDPRMSGA